MERGLYSQDHEDFRAVVRTFVAREVTPNVSSWESDRLIGRDLWIAAGRASIIGLTAPSEYGGAGTRDYRFRSVVLEELGRVFATSVAASLSLQDDVAIPYLVSLGSNDQRRQWLPGMCAGELIGAVAMSEPSTGSDLRAISTSATRATDGWVVNGAKTFVTNGVQSDLVIVVTRTARAGGSRGFTLLVVEQGMEGFSRGRKLDKVGLHGQDTAELFFSDVFVPDSHVLGCVGEALPALTHHLPLERLSIAVHAMAFSTSIFDDTVRYVDQRMAFGKPVADFQHTRFELAELATELDVARAYVDKAILAYGTQDLTAVDAAKAKWWATDLQSRLVDRCLQLHGGYGFMMEYPVGRMYQDARVGRIFGGTNEIMKEIIGRDIVGRR